MIPTGKMSDFGLEWDLGRQAKNRIPLKAQIDPMTTPRKVIVLVDSR